MKSWNNIEDAYLLQGAIVGYTPRGMELAQEALVFMLNPMVFFGSNVQVNMTKRNFLLNAKFGSDLFLAAAGEKTGGYTNANYIWDLMQARNVVPSLAAVEAYYNSLKERETPEDDPRLQIITRTLNNLRSRFAIGLGGR
ncbi:pentatricopeptide repeat-containing protein At4g35850, mitochondrial-like [Hibiscus syriacus]|uniref:pentatricopeptide repeat-containing protein At4g35850, mitochondrial-like n=1 Tax=Hibiscus syriacus TaxID=106335 RepID=UPI00192134B9|nr:pentatricopeptide repeat-containing protein At4g35850, mitochondrial-like [Hibiscus syriacus]